MQKGRYDINLTSSCLLQSGDFMAAHGPWNVCGSHQPSPLRAHRAESGLWSEAACYTPCPVTPFTYSFRWCIPSYRRGKDHYLDRQGTYNNGPPLKRVQEAIILHTFGLQVNLGAIVGNKERLLWIPQFRAAAQRPPKPNSLNFTARLWYISM